MLLELPTSKNRYLLVPFEEFFPGQQGIVHPSALKKLAKQDDVDFIKTVFGKGSHSMS